MRAWLSRLTLLELVPPVLARAMDPFPLPVRTLDALHLASMVFLRTRGLAVRLATYDARQAEVARVMGFEVVEPSPPAPLPQGGRGGTETLR